MECSYRKYEERNKGGKGDCINKKEECEKNK
jgi:hypothetical protein